MTGQFDGGVLLRLAMVATIPAYALLQVVALIAFKDRWRLFAALPLLAMAPACLIAAQGYRTGQAGWPLPFVYACPIALALLLVVGIFHRTKRKPGQPAGMKTR